MYLTGHGEIAKAADTARYRSIRAICEDRTDITEISLVYANRSESDIPMRKQLDRFAETSDGKFKIYYMVDKPSEGWSGGVGFVSKQVMQERLPGSAEGKPIQPQKSRGG